MQAHIYQHLRCQNESVLASLLKTARRTGLPVQSGFTAREFFEAGRRDIVKMASGVIVVNLDEAAFEFSQPTNAAHMERLLSFRNLTP